VNRGNLFIAWVWGEGGTQCDNGRGLNRGSRGKEPNHPKGQLSLVAGLRGVHLVAKPQYGLSDQKEGGSEIVLPQRPTCSGESRYCRARGNLKRVGNGAKCGGKATVGGEMVT